MNPQNNYNWMPLREAMTTLGLDCVVWWMNHSAVNENTFKVRTLLGYVCDDKKFADGLDIMVCKALVPEPRSWGEQGKWKETQEKRQIA